MHSRLDGQFWHPGRAVLHKVQLMLTVFKKDKLEHMQVEFDASSNPLELSHNVQLKLEIQVRQPFIAD